MDKSIVEEDDYDPAFEFCCDECMGETECEKECMCQTCVETDGYKHLKVYGYD